MSSQSRRTLAALALSAGLVVGLSVAGREARNWLDGRGHYRVAFADVECVAPPGLSRATFLTEVQYLGALPDHVSTIDPATTLRVAAAFALHPWVESVTAVKLRTPTGPRAELVLRTPALAVGDRVADRNGVLLPAEVKTDGLIRLSGDASPPSGPAGAPWGDPGVEAAARVAAELGAFQDCLRLTTAETSEEGLTFTGAVRVRWGRPVPAESAAKLDRIRERCGRPGGPGDEIDLRMVP